MTKKGWITVAILAALIAISMGLNIWQYDKSKTYSIQYGSDSTKVEKIKISDGEVEVEHIKQGKKKIKKMYIAPEGKTVLDLGGYNKQMEKVDEIRYKIERINSLLNEKDSVLTGQQLSGIFRNIWELDKSPLHLNVKNYGFTSRFQIGFGVGGYKDRIEQKFIFGWKFLFWNRLNIGAYVNQDLLGVGLGRHMDDLVPIFKNAELRLVIGPGFKNITNPQDLNFWLGVTVDL